MDLGIYVQRRVMRMRRMRLQTLAIFALVLLGTVS